MFCLIMHVKAYDRISRDKLWAVLLQYGVGGQLLTAIKSLYMHSEVCVSVNNATTKPFGVSVGLRQGCSLSPILFLICMDRIVKKSESCGGVKIVDALYNVCYSQMIFYYSTLPKMVSSRLLTDFHIHALLPE